MGRQTTDLAGNIMARMCTNNSNATLHDTKQTTEQCNGEHLVEYCVRNVDVGDTNRIEKLDAEVIEQFCLQRCGDCDAESFLVVDGVYIAGNHVALAETIEEGGAIR